MKQLLLLILVSLTLTACQKQSLAPVAIKDLTQEGSPNQANTMTTPLTPPPSQPPNQDILKLEAGQQLLATIKTNQGNIKLRLFVDKAPQTVANFVGLSEGSLTWTNPQTNQPTNTPLYNNTVFHRIIADFMIQGGDPLGNGSGGPGYKFSDEIDPEISFNKKGLLAMANSGPNTNGSQFFITLAPTPWLNGNHTIFGEVVAGMEVVEKIGSLETDAQDRPQEKVIISAITIERE